jgi:hypothetical protein
MTCTASPCCTYLLVRNFQFESLTDVDYGAYILNFEGFLLRLHRDGKVDVYFHQPCRLLDVGTGLCTVHGTEDQPSVCVHYNAHSCWYRHGMTADVDRDGPLLDRARMKWLAARMTFDDSRQVTGSPDWEEMLQTFESMPVERRQAPAPPPDPVFEEWRSITLSPNGPERSPQPHRFGDAVVSDPCRQCEAWCCKTLIFHRSHPTNAGQVDFLRYCTGFPGVEIGVSNEDWALIVRATCRHLKDNRCSVFGTDERPLRCTYYDELKCKYRLYFGTPRPEDMIRIPREHFGVLAASVMFDDQGQVTGLPSVDALRAMVEEAERAKAGVP